MNLTDKQINDNFNNLPDEIQDFIMSDYRRRLVEDIIRTNGIDDTAGFRREVLILQIGLITIDQFLDDLRTNFGKTKEEADDILIDIDEAILEDLNDILEYSSEPEEDTLPEKGETSPEAPAQAEPVQKFDMPSVSVAASSEITTSAPAPIAVEKTPPAKTEEIEAYEPPRMPVIPPKVQTAGSNILESKLQSTTNLPRVEVKLDIPPAYPTGKDPYRETL